MASAAHVSSLEVSTKEVIVCDNWPAITLRFKEFYIIRKANAESGDYTGLRVWPGAEMLARFLYAAGSQGMLNHIGVVELGAGVGLAGLVAARFCAHCGITDRVPVLLQLIQENIVANGLQDKASAHELDWGVEGANKIREQIGGYSESNPSSASTTSSSAVASAPPKFVWQPASGCVIAADVVYPDTSEAALGALFATADTLLHAGDSADLTQSDTAPTSTAASVSASSSSSSSAALILPHPLAGSFFCSYFSRDSATTERMLRAAAAARFDAFPIPLASFDPDAAAIEADDSRTQGVLIQFRRASQIEMVLEDAAATSNASGSTSSLLPRFMLHPALLRLWRPALSRAAQAVEDLHAQTEDQLFSGLGGMDSDEDDKS